VPAKVIETDSAIIGHLARHFQVGSQVLVNMVLIAKSRPVQYLATASWKPEDERNLNIEKVEFIKVKR